MNLTAALMSSEEAYATKRSEFIQMAEDQAIRGIYTTRLVEKTVEAANNLSYDRKVNNKARN